LLSFARSSGRVHPACVGIAARDPGPSRGLNDLEQYAGGGKFVSFSYGSPGWSG